MQQSCGYVGVTPVWLIIYSQNLEKLIKMKFLIDLFCVVLPSILEWETSQGP